MKPQDFAQLKHGDKIQIVQINVYPIKVGDQFTVDKVRTARVHTSLLIVDCIEKYIDGQPYSFYCDEVELVTQSANNITQFYGVKKNYVLDTLKPQAVILKPKNPCECGAHVMGALPNMAGHSHWCPVALKDKPQEKLKFKF